MKDEMNEPYISGYACLRMTVNFVEDLRALVKYLDKYHVSDEIEVELDRNKVFVTLVEGEGEFISCGDHVPPDDAYDVILNTHSHSSNDHPANFEEALEDALPVDVPKYDWMARDRYTVMWDGMPA